MSTESTYTAVVHRKVLSKEAVFNTRGERIGEKQIESDVWDNPLTDEEGTPIEAASEAGLLRLVKDHLQNFSGTVIRVFVRETKTVKEVSEEEFKAL